MLARCKEEDFNDLVDAFVKSTLAAVDEFKLCDQFSFMTHFSTQIQIRLLLFFVRYTAERNLRLETKNL